jgi:hypothetical protein
MDVVYICRPGDNEELRYSIRSVVKNLAHDSLWVVGDKPDWYGGNFLYSNLANSQYFQVWNNLRAIIDCPEISDDFILMNDDFFIVDYVDSVDYFYWDVLESVGKWRKDNGYGGQDYVNKHFATAHQLWVHDKIKNPLNYELHVPMVFNKEKLAKIIGRYQLYRSGYGNVYGVGGYERRDVKVYSNPKLQAISFDYQDEYTEYLSSEDVSFEQLREDLLAVMFSEKSQYELDL